MGVTRRQFLFGAGALGAAAGGGAAALQIPAGRRLLHAAGLLVDDDLRPPDGTFASEVSVLPSGRQYRITRTGMSGGASGASVAAADAAASAGGVPAVICLHGRNQSHAFAFDVIALHAFAGAAGHDMVIASLDGGRTSYWHRRRLGGDPLAAVFDELVPIVDARSGGGPRTVMGWSMGGYGALLAAQIRPELFDRVVAASPAVWRRAADASAGAFDGPEDFAAHDVLDGLSRLRARVRIDCGRDDPFADVSRELLRRIPGAVGGVRAGFHDAPFWRTLVPEQLAFITGS